MREYVAQAFGIVRLAIGVEHASDLALAGERGAHSVILPGALEAALILQAEAPDLAVDPDVHESVIVFLIRTAGDHIAGGDLDVRLPVGQQVFSRERDLHAV